MNKYFEGVAKMVFKTPETKVVAPARILITNKGEFEKVEAAMIKDGYSLYLASDKNISNIISKGYEVVAIDGLPVYFKDTILTAKK